MHFRQQIYIGETLCISPEDKEGNNGKPIVIRHLQKIKFLLLEIFTIFVPEIKSVMREKKLLERLYQLRTERQIPSQDLAKILGVEPPMYSRMERGSRNIKVEHLKKIAEFYHVDCDELHVLWVADKLSEFAQGLPQEVFEQAISILNRERDKDDGEGQ